MGLGLGSRELACPFSLEAGDLEAKKELVEWGIRDMVHDCVILMRRVACAVRESHYRRSSSAALTREALSTYKGKLVK